MAISVFGRGEVAGDSVTIVIASDSGDPNVAREELEHADTRHLAIREGAKAGLSSPGVDGFPEIYPVNANNIRLDEIRPGQMTKGGKKQEPLEPAAWHAAVKIQGRPM